MADGRAGIVIEGERGGCYFPIVTMLIIRAILTIAVNRSSAAEAALRAKFRLVRLPKAIRSVAAPEPNVVSGPALRTDGG